MLQFNFKFEALCFVKRLNVGVFALRRITDISVNETVNFTAMKALFKLIL